MSDCPINYEYTGPPESDDRRYTDSTETAVFVGVEYNWGDHTTSIVFAGDSPDDEWLRIETAPCDLSEMR